MVTSDKGKVHIEMLAGLCAAYGLKKVVISPGSRSAPLAVAFHHQAGIECYVVPDERSAGYFALGIAQYTQQPVGLICTSGTAALNYTPAIAEAFYQHLPVLAITADRPPEWIGQLDGQTIQQSGIYHNFVSYEAQFPVEVFTSSERWHIERLIRDGFLHLQRKRVPVHFNVPLREPLYDRGTPKPLDMVVPVFLPEKISLSDRNFGELGLEMSHYSRILLVVGMRRPDDELSNVLSQLSSLENVVILCETLSNLKGETVFQTSDALLFSIKEHGNEKLKPELVISFGDILLSKPLKQWIRSFTSVDHWLIHEDDAVPDVFQHITRIIHCSPVIFLQNLWLQLKHTNNEFFSEWRKKYQTFSQLHGTYIQSIPWSDMQAFNILSQYVPDGSYVHLGNSSPVRYAQFFHWNTGIRFFSNRGTAGIDGCTSTAIGMASQTGIPVTLITGDVSFLYDSNGLWNIYKKPNFKLIVINNKGGNIFSLIPGPESTGLLAEYFITHVPVSIEYLCKAYGITYYQANNEQELSVQLNEFYNRSECSLLEIHTEMDTNTRVWKDYFKRIRGMGEEEGC